MKGIKHNTRIRAELLIFVIINLFYQVVLIKSSYGQKMIDTTTSKHIFFTQPLGYLLKDYSLGYELKINENKSYTLIIDVFEPWKNDYKIGDTPTELEIYKGLCLRFGIKKLKKSNFYHSVESMYKISGYENKLILRENSEGEAADKYYIEKRVCNSLGCDYKFGYELNKNHFFLSPFFLAGARVRYDIITIRGKYDWLNNKLSDKTEHSYRIWPIPILQIGFMLGFGI